MKRLLCLSAVSAALLASLAGSASAGTTTGSLPVTLEVISACTLTVTVTDTIDFGQTPSTVTDLTDTGVFNVACDNNTSYKVGLNAGQNAASAFERKLKLAGGNDTVKYHVYKEAALTTEWGDIAGVSSPVSAVGAVTFTAYAAVKASENGGTKAVGIYNDALKITVAF